MKNDSISKHIFCNFRGYGDLIIEASIIKNHRINNYEIYIGEHLYQLAKFLFDKEKIFVIKGINKIPLLLDLKKLHNLNNIIQNFLYLRKILKKMILNKIIIYPNIKFREKMIFFGICKVKTNFYEKKNIYYMYNEILNVRFSPKQEKIIYTDISNIIIYPLSSNIKKDITYDNLIKITNLLDQKKISYKIFIYKDQNDYFKKNYNNIKYSIIKSFDYYFEMKKKNIAVITSDTFFAHLFNYFEVPVLTIFNSKNIKYLNLFSFENNFYNINNNLLKILDNFLYYLKIEK